MKFLVNYLGIHGDLGAAPVVHLIDIKLLNHATQVLLYVEIFKFNNLHDTLLVRQLSKQNFEPLQENPRREK